MTSFGRITRALLEVGLRGAVVILQEIGRWHGGACADGYVVHSRGPAVGAAGSDCGFLLPRQLSHLVADEFHGDFWSGIVVGRVILLSAHILDHDDPAGRASTVIPGKLSVELKGFRLEAGRWA